MTTEEVDAILEMYSKLSFMSIVEKQQKKTDDYGYNYNSSHEFESVLREELEEVQESIDDIKSMYKDMWKEIRDNEFDTSRLECIQEQAENCIYELAQVISVCIKANRGFKGDKC